MEHSVNNGKKDQMRHFISIMIMVAIFVAIGPATFAAEQKLPVIKGKKIVAMVDDEPITYDEFKQNLGIEEGGGNPKKEKDLLRRLINTRLLVQEGKRIGLDQLPNIKKDVEIFSRITLREELMNRYLKNIKPDEKEIDKVYREATKEWKISSILFEKEENAKKTEKNILEGKSFEEIFKSSVGDGTAKAAEEGKYFKEKDLLPEIAGAITKLKVGEVSPIIPIKSGFVISKVEDIRVTESAEVKEWAKQEALRLKQKDALSRYDKELKKKHAKINQKVLDGIDLEAKELGFNKLLEDKRVLVEIQGERPITVGEFTEYVRQQLFHGVERAIETKRLNKKKAQTLDEMLHKRVFQKEALRLGIDKTESYRNRVREHEDSLIFGTLVQKAVAPDVKLEEDDLKTYYAEHIQEYTYPEMMKIQDLVFSKREDAEKAVMKLKQGTDFQWLQANEEGQVEKDTKGVLEFDGKQLLTTKDLPEEVQKAVSGARSGDVRLYASSRGYFYALLLQEVVPSKPQPYDEARVDIAKKVYNEKLKKAVEDYADKLRAVSEVKIYLK